MPSPRANIPPPTVQDCSSAGRASVSKTECRGFESLHSCQNLHVHAYKRNGRWTFLERGHSRSGWKTVCGFWLRCFYGICTGWGLVAKTYSGDFVRQVRVEVSKIVWPTSRETMVTNIMVVIMNYLLGLLFFGMDSVFGWAVLLLLVLA